MALGIADFHAAEGLEVRSDLAGVTVVDGLGTGIKKSRRITCLRILVQFL
jgi:hypothetical protein